MRLQVSQAHIQRQTAKLSLETARAAIDQATESLRILKNRYGAGLATITDLLRAEDAERQSADQLLARCLRQHHGLCRNCFSRPGH